MLLKKVKKFYNKEGFDYTAGYVDPRDYHFTFFYVQRAFQVIDEPFKPWTYVSKTITLISGIGILTDACLSFYHAIDIFDMGLITESGTYVFMLLYKMMNLLITKLCLPKYIHLIRAMKDDFKYIDTKSNKYKKLFFETQLGTWQLCIGTCAFMIWLSMSLVLFAIAALIYYLMTHPPGDRENRPLVFPFWAPGIDYTTTPAFEIAFTFANIGVLACTYNYTFVLQTNIVWVRQIASRAEIIGMCIKDLLDGIHPTEDVNQKQYYAKLVNYRMREIVSNHVAMYELLDSYAGVYKKCLMFEQIVSSPVICMLAYCSAEKIDAGDIHVVMMVLCVGAIMVLFIPCYLCTYLRTKKMTSAYSLFNMLRQADLDL